MERLPFIALGAAMASLWIFPRPAIWLTFLGAALALAVKTGTINVPALGAALAVTGGAFAFFRIPMRNARRIPLGVGVIGAVLALFVHLIPGFRDLVVLPLTVITAGAYPTSIVWSFDKPLAGLLLLGWGHRIPRERFNAPRAIFWTLALYVCCAFLLGAPACALHAFRWSPHWTDVGLFAGTNLFFACVPEEALFRGFLQRALARRWENFRHGSAWAVAASAVLFGLGHFAGGPGLMFTAGVAGLFYGEAYRRTGRLESAIAVHFLINLTHFSLFTYPALRP